MNQYPPKQIFLVVILVLSTGILGYFLGARKITYVTQPSVLPSQPTVSNPSPLFINQTAMVAGKVSQVDKDSLSVINDKNQTDSFPVSKKFIVFVPVKDTKTANASSDVKLIEINKPALITLELIEGKYQVVSLSYLP